MDIEKLKKWYKFKIWTKSTLADAVRKEKITSEDYKEITGEDFK